MGALPSGTKNAVRIVGGQWTASRDSELQPVGLCLPMMPASSRRTVYHDASDRLGITCSSFPLAADASIWLLMGRPHLTAGHQSGSSSSVPPSAQAISECLNRRDIQGSSWKMPIDDPYSYNVFL